MLVFFFLFDWVFDGGGLGLGVVIVGKLVSGVVFILEGLLGRCLVERIVLVLSRVELKRGFGFVWARI